MDIINFKKEAIKRGKDIIEQEETHADSIRNMTDEELADFLDYTQKRVYEFLDIEFKSLKNGWLSWLKEKI